MILSAKALRKRSRKRMFGYVKALTPELRVKEFELYKSVYCGLCHHIKKRSSLMTFSLSYDFVLPALFSLAFTDIGDISFKKKRCLVHPFRKRKVIDGGENMQAVADAAILLVYYKLLDDKTDKDERFFKRLSSSSALPFAARARKKVLKAGYTPIDDIIKEKIASLSLCEKENCASVYDGATIFGELLAEVFSASVKRDYDRRCMYEIGFRVGRWIYIADALDDIQKDIKNQSYNPFIASGDDTSSDSFKENIEMALRLELSESEKALDLLEISDPGIFNLIQNILYIGMPDVIHRILYKDAREKCE